MCTLDMKIIDNTCKIISVTQAPRHCWEHLKTVQKGKNLSATLHR